MAWKLKETTSSVLLKWYGTNQPQLERDTRAKCKKTHVICVHMQKSNFVCACLCNLNQFLNGYTVVGLLSVDASKY